MGRVKTIMNAPCDICSDCCDFEDSGGVVDWNDASQTFNVTLELVRRGYAEDQIEKIWAAISCA